MLNQLQDELIIAMKAGDKASMTGLRNIIGKLKAAQIDKGEILNDEESMKILKSTTKQLKESIDHYRFPISYLQRLLSPQTLPSL